MSLPTPVRLSRRTRLEILESNYGRDAGWWVLMDGEPVAQLTHPRYADMFWTAYDFEALSDRPELLRKQFWDACPRLRNRRFGLEITVMGGPPNGGVVVLRGDQIDIEPTLLERVLLRFRRTG